MEIANLQQPSLCSIDMGCMEGASDYFDNDLSTAMIYGLSGYGYMINIYKDLYDASGNGLKRIASKELDRETKRSLLKETAERERELEANLEALISLAS